MKIFGRISNDTDPGQRRAAGNIFKFLAVLLALTLIARGTSGATLAKVNVSTPARGTIIESVTGSASVSAADILEIKAPEGLTIADVWVVAGQRVEYGDTVASFDMEELREKWLREKAGLDKMRLDLEKLERVDGIDATSLDNARRSLQRAREDYNTTLSQGEEDIAAALEALDEALNAVADDPDASSLQSAVKSYQRAMDDYEKIKSQGESDIAAAVEALEILLEKKPDPADNASLQSAQRSRQRAKDDHESVKKQGEDDTAAAFNTWQEAIYKENLAYTDWLVNPESPEAERAFNAAQAETIKTENAYHSTQTRAKDNLLSAARRLEDADASLAQAQQNYNKNSEQIIESRKNEIERAETAVTAAEDRAKDNLLSAARRVEDAETNLNTARQNYNKNMELSSDSISLEIERTQKAYDTAKKRADDNLFSAARRLEDAEINYTQARQNYNKNTEQYNETLTQNSINLVTLRLDIQTKESFIQELEALMKDEGIIYAGLEGTVISFMAKKSVTGKNALVTLRDDAGGYKAKMQLHKNDADKLAVGGECEVTTGGGSMYYNPTVFGWITEISNPDESNKVTVTIMLPEGNWKEGQRVDAQTVLSSGTYDMCVSLSALRSDNAGYYIYILERHSTVLGIQNIVTRVNVTVAASDDTQASIRGALGRSSQVITGNNKTITAGDRVRVDE